MKPNKKTSGKKSKDEKTSEIESTEFEKISLTRHPLHSPEYGESAVSPEDVPEKDLSDNEDTTIDESESDSSLQKVKYRKNKSNSNNEDANRTPKSENKQNDTSTRPKSFYYYALPKSFYYYAAIFSILIFTIVGYIYIFPSRANSEILNVDSIINDIKNNFPNQSNLTFRLVKGAIKRALLNPESPGIIILLADEETKYMCHEFKFHLLKSVSQHSDYIKIESNPSKNPEDLKKHIDKKLSNSLIDNSLNVVVVDELDKIPFEAALIFHSYCDHENAPFKKVLYVMTVTATENITGTSTPKVWDHIASTSLNKAWEGSNKDQVASLISRLTVCVAAIIHNS